MTASTGTATSHTARRDLLLGLATVLYVAGAIALLSADEPLTTRMSITQTAALFGCGVLIVRRTDTPVIGWLLVVSSRSVATGGGAASSSSRSSGSCSRSPASRCTS